MTLLNKSGTHMILREDPRQESTGCHNDVHPSMMSRAGRAKNLQY